ncbi:nitroreductase family protein [soil metagenome]
MEFSEVIRRRRMVRNYADKPVPREVLERIALAAQRAPSAGFSQGQRLVIVTDADKRRAVAEVCDEANYVEAGFDPWISRAPALFVPCVSEEVYRARYREPDKRRPGEPEMDWPVPYWWVDVGCTSMLIVLAAVDEGLAAGFLGSNRISDLQAVLGIPSDFIPAGVITVGHPAPDRRSGSLRRGWVPNEEFARWERW